MPKNSLLWYLGSCLGINLLLQLLVRSVFLLNLRKKVVQSYFGLFLNYASSQLLLFALIEMDLKIIFFDKFYSSLCEGETRAIL